MADAPVRPVTDDEVTFFHDNGWVYLPSLITPQTCEAMLARGRPRMAGMLDGAHSVSAYEDSTREHMTVADAKGQGTVTDIKQWVEWRGAVRDARDPAFCAVSLDKQTGSNVRRLLGRDRPMRVYHDILTCKLPDLVSIPTSYHQDGTNFPIDRNALTIWIALVEITPDMGPVQFYSGSHREGLLGSIPFHSKFDLVEEYPELVEKYPLSPAHHMMPGDATVHHSLTVHGAAANSTDRQRWSFLTSYFPEGARYSGAPNHDTDGLDLKRGYEIEHPSFALVDG